MPTLSSRATTWLDGLGVTQRRPHLDQAAVRRWLTTHEMPVWRLLLAVAASRTPTRATRC